MPGGLMTTIWKHVAVAAAGAAVLALLLALVHHYKRKADTTTERLQAVTTELTEPRDAYDRYVNEQRLIRDLLAVGAAAKQITKDKTDDAIKQHKASDTTTTVSPAYKDLRSQ